MLHLIFIVLSTGLGTASQMPDPSNLIDRADLTDPHAFILQTEQFVETQKQGLLEQKERNHIQGIHFQETTLSFNPQKHPGLLSAKLAIRTLLTQMHLNSEIVELEKTKERIGKNRESIFIKELCDRGLTRDEVAQIMMFASHTYLGYGGIVAIATEKLEKQFFRNPAVSKDIDDFEKGQQLSKETIKALTDAKFYEYTKIEDAAYGDFLSYFSYRSRRIIMSYAYERLL